MRFQVELAARARADLVEIYRWIAQDSPVNAARWVAEVEAAIATLGASPRRCGLAPEGASIEDFEIRRLIVGRYRVLFTVQAQTVFVLRVRHGSRGAATQEGLSETAQQGPPRPDP